MSKPIKVVQFMITTIENAIGKGQEAHVLDDKGRLWCSNVFVTNFGQVSSDEWEQIPLPEEPEEKEPEQEEVPLLALPVGDSGRTMIISTTTGPDISLRNDKQIRGHSCDVYYDEIADFGEPDGQ